MHHEKNKPFPQMPLPAGADMEKLLIRRDGEIKNGDKFQLNQNVTAAIKMEIDKAVSDIATKFLVLEIPEIAAQRKLFKYHIPTGVVEIVGERASYERIAQ